MRVPLGVRTYAGWLGVVMEGCMWEDLCKTDKVDRIRAFGAMDAGIGVGRNVIAVGGSHDGGHLYMSKEDQSSDRALETGSVWPTLEVPALLGPGEAPRTEAYAVQPPMLILRRGFQFAVFTGLSREDAEARMSMIQYDIQQILSGDDAPRVPTGGGPPPEKIEEMREWKRGSKDFLKGRDWHATDRPCEMCGAPLRERFVHMGTGFVLPEGYAALPWADVEGLLALFTAVDEADLAPIVFARRNCTVLWCEPCEDMRAVPFAGVVAPGAFVVNPPPPSPSVKKNRKESP